MSFHSLLIPECGGGTLVAAIADYYESSVYDPPSVTVLSANASTVERAKQSDLEIDLRREDFLGDHVSFQRNFDYVLSDAPTVSWTELSVEQRRAYAANSGSISTDDDTISDIDAKCVFIEQALRHLEDDGRAVFLTDPRYKTEEDASDFREMLYQRTEDIVEVLPENYSQLHTEQVITVINDETDSGSVPTIRYDASEYEAMLNRRVNTTSPFTASAVMTSDLKGYDASETASSVYLDLVHNDYDAAPIYDGDSILGFVSRETLRADQHDTVGAQARDFSDAYVLSEDAELPSVIESLGRHRFQFVESSGEITGIITRFDLNQLPLYLHLYDCFSEFEIGLRNLIRRRLPDWREVTDEYVSSQSEEELFADKLASAKLSNLVQIVREGGLREDIQPDISAYDPDLQNLTRLRNSIAHYNPIVHTMGDTDTFDEDRRSAIQLGAEYRFLHHCIDGLES